MNTSFGNYSIVAGGLARGMAVGYRLSAIGKNGYGLWGVGYGVWVFSKNRGSVVGCR